VFTLFIDGSATFDLTSNVSMKAYSFSFFNCLYTCCDFYSPPVEREVLLAASAWCTYFKNHTSKFYQIFSTRYLCPWAMARSSSDGNAICYVFPVLCMTSCFHIIIGNGTNRDSLLHITNSKWYTANRIAKISKTLSDFKVVHLLQPFSNYQMRFFVHTRNSWQDFNWHGASRGSSTTVELLFCIKRSIILQKNVSLTAVVVYNELDLVLT